MGLRSSSHDDDVPDKYTGMTRRQIKTVYKSWKLLKKDPKKHSIMIFVRFFRKYPMYRRYFLDVTGVKMSDLVRHPGVLAHCDAFMKANDRMLNAALKKPETLNEFLAHMAKFHKDMASNVLDLQRMSETIINYLKKEFPKETTEYVLDCWQKYHEMLIGQYNAIAEELRAAEEIEDTIPVHASRRSSTNQERMEKDIWDKHREYWRNKKATWDDTNVATYAIEDEEEEDYYILMRNKNSRCCGVSSIFGEKEKTYPSSEKPLVGKEITETRSITTIKEVNIDLDDTGKSVSTEGPGIPTANSRLSDGFFNNSRNGSGSFMSEYSTTSEIINSEPSPLDVSIRKLSLPPEYYERRLSALFPKKDVVNENNYVTPSYVPGRNIDDMDIPMPKFFKKERKDKRSQSVTFDNDITIREYEDYSQETVADGPRERRRKWNEFTSCCNKRNSYY